MKKTITPIQSYTGEYFDNISTLALLIADDERAAGRVEPQHGYSHDDWLRAEKVIKNSGPGRISAKFLSERVY